MRNLAIRRKLALHLLPVAAAAAAITVATAVTPAAAATAGPTGTGTHSTATISATGQASAGTASPAVWWPQSDRTSHTTATGPHASSTASAGAAATHSSLGARAETFTVPAHGTGSPMTVTTRLVPASQVQPADAFVCNGHTCQQLTGSGLTLTSWVGGVVQGPSTTVCNLTVSFRYNVTATSWDVWKSGSVYPGCYTTAANQTRTWWAEGGPKTFPSATWVQVGWNSGFGSTPSAHVTP